MTLAIRSPLFAGSSWVGGAKNTSLETGMPAAKNMNNWPADRVERWPIERLIPYARNARTHSPAQVAQIAASIRAFGFTNPILAGDTGDIVAGHGRLAAARQLGLTEVPVIALRGLSEVQRRQLVLADNRIALNAGWDADMLRLELCDLRELGADLSELGFTRGRFKGRVVAFGKDLGIQEFVPSRPPPQASRDLVGPFKFCIGTFEQ